MTPIYDRKKNFRTICAGPYFGHFQISLQTLNLKPKNNQKVEDFDGRSPWEKRGLFDAWISGIPGAHGYYFFLEKSRHELDGG